MSKNETNILSRTETRGNTAYVDDLIINEKYIYKMSLVNIRAKEVLIRIEIDLIFYDTVLYQNASWHGIIYLIFHMR
jgi:hypothetical protein